MRAHVIHERDAVPTAERLVQQLLTIVAVEQLRHGVRAVHEREHDVELRIERRRTKCEEERGERAQPQHTRAPSPEWRNHETRIRARDTLTLRAAERGGEVGHVLKAVRGNRRERLEHGGIDRLRHLGALVPNRCSGIAEALGENRDGARPTERHLAGQHLVHHAAEAVQITPAVDRICGALLGAHVRNRPDGKAGVGETAATRTTHGVRNAEIADERVSFGKQDVLRLDVAMDDVARVRVRQRVSDLAREPNRLVYRERSVARDAAAQRLTRDVRHHKEERALPLTRVVEGEDVRMLQAREERDLATKALGRLTVGDFGVDELERDLTVVPNVMREVDGRHPASADLAFDLVASGDDCALLAGRGERVRRLRVVGHVSRPCERRRE